MNQQAMPSALSLMTSPVCGLNTSTPFTFTRSLPSFSENRSISGSPKMTKRLPLPVFLRSSAMCRSAFMRALSAGMRLGGVRLVVERAGDQHVETSITGLAGCGNQVGALDGAELRANEDGCALLSLT